MAPAVVRSDRDGQGGLLGHQNRAIGSAGLHLTGFDLRSGDTAFGRRLRRRIVDLGRRNKSADADSGHRRTRTVGDHDCQLRHHMVENHADRRRNGRNVGFHGRQQVGRPVALRLIRGDGEFVGSSAFGIGIIGRQYGLFIQVVVPRQPGRRKSHAVVGHRHVLGVRGTPFGDRQTDTVAGIEMQTRDARTDSRSDLHAKRTFLGLCAAGRNEDRQSHEQNLSHLLIIAKSDFLVQK